MDEQNHKIKNESKKLYKQYIKNKRYESDFVFIESLITEINDLSLMLKICIMITLQKIQQSIVASKNLLVNS